MVSTQSMKLPRRVDQWQIIKEKQALKQTNEIKNKGSNQIEAEATTQTDVADNVLRLLLLLLRFFF